MQQQQQQQQADISLGSDPFAEWCGALAVCVHRHLNPATALLRVCAQRASSAAREFKIDDVFPLIAGTRGREAEKNGDPDGGQWSAGRSVGLINDIPTVAELVQNFIHEAYDTFNDRLAKILGGPKL